MKSMRILLPISLALTALCGYSLGEDWPQWRGKHQNGVWIPSGEIAKKWPTSGPKVVWTQPIGAAYSGLAVAKGRVYTMDRLGNRERVICLDEKNGKVIWIRDYPAKYGKLTYSKGPRSTPTVAGNHVYTFGAVGHLVCLNAKNGEVVWKKDLVSSHKAKQPEWGFAASPAIFGELVIVHAGLQPNGCFAAFDRKTGKEVWRSGSDPVGYCTPLFIQHQSGTAMVGWTPRNVLAISPQTGRILWKIPYKVTLGVAIASPIFHRNTLLVCGYWEGSKAIQVGPHAKRAKLLWEENRFLRGLMSQPLYRGGYVYLLDKKHGLVCFELRTGKKKWSDKNRLTPRGRNPQVTLVWIGKTDRAMCLNSNGELVQIRLTPNKYDELARAKIVDATWAHPAYVGTRMVVRDDKRIICLELGR